MIDQLTHTPEHATEPLAQHEIDSRFDEIVVELIGINSTLDDTDLQADVVTDLKVRQGELLSDLLRHPAKAVNQEFELLQRLYEGRTSVTYGQLGTVTSEFVTRDPERQKADLHFREVAYESGRMERIVEVPSRESDGLPFFAIASGGELMLEQIVYRRGTYQHIRIDPLSEQGQRLMTQFLTHSITASDLMYNRLPEEIDEADRQARHFLAAKKIAQTTL